MFIADLKKSSLRISLPKLSSGLEILTNDALHIILRDDFDSVFPGNVSVEGTNVESS